MKETRKTGNDQNAVWILSGAISLIPIGMADALTGHEVSFSIFYLIPIFFITGNRELGATKERK